MINELSALKRIQERFHKKSEGLELGIGDDAAAVRIGAGNLLLATTDSQVEDVHFLKSQISAALLARKAVAVSVSDIAAMGGVPKFILATVGFSEQEDENYLDGLISGFEESENDFGVELIGGNLSSSDKLFIDITVLGEVEPDLLVTRSGAEIGDGIFVSGTLGDSALGLKIIQNNQKQLSSAFLHDRHLKPSPRLELGRKLSLNKLASSMIDISDGLLLDLERISVQQGKGAAINLANLPTSKEYNKMVGEFYKKDYEAALSGGEDYELLFTSAKKNSSQLNELSEKLNLRITEIGEITDTMSLEFLNSNDEINIEKRGFVHFGV